jgi:hypothetical protein
MSVKKLIPFVVNCSYGMTIREAASLEEDRKEAYEENGTRNVVGVYEATKEDIDHYRAMGGMY